MNASPRAKAPGREPRGPAPGDDDSASGLAQRALAGLASLLAALSALAVGAIVVVLVFSAVQRYALARPMPETEELAGFLFVALAFLSIADGFVRNRQIRIEMVWRKLPVRVQGWATIAGHLLTLAVLALLARELFGFARVSMEFGSRSDNADILMWPWMMLMPLGIVTLALAVAVRIAVDLRRMRTRRPVVEAEAASAPTPE